MDLYASPVSGTAAAHEFEDDELVTASSAPDLISDDDIDYAGIARRTQPDQPGGRIIFDSADYATDEEAMLALEALFLHDLMAPLNEAPSAG
jgi:hypothetical protein